MLSSRDRPYTVHSVQLLRTDTHSSLSVIYRTDHTQRDSRTIMSVIIYTLYSVYR